MKHLAPIAMGLVLTLLHPLSATSKNAAYFASAAGPYGTVANNAGLNIGHTFTVANTNIQVSSLGVYDFGGDGLNASHQVTLFSNQVAIASVTVPAGTSAPLVSGFRFAALPEPLLLSPGSYAVVAYQMNGTANGSDGYGDQPTDGTSGFNGTFNLFDGNPTTIFEFTTDPSAYPGTGGASLGTAASDLASASFLYTEPGNTNLLSYTADPTQTRYGSAANNPGLNIGHTFVVSGSGIRITRLGLFDYGADGLQASHTLTLFTNNTPLISVTVPAGTAAPLGNGFRFVTLATPIQLPAGNYALIAYSMKGTSNGSDGYGENNTAGFNPGVNVSDGGFSPYQFVTSGSPAYPTGGANDFNFAIVSFEYTPLALPQGPTVAYTALTNGVIGANANNTGLNIGHTFTVVNTNIVISSLGVYDYLGDGLAAAHPVTLFANVSGRFVPVTGGSVTIPAGTVAPLTNGYRFQPLPAPISVPPGTYAVVAYQMNGPANNSDPYTEASGANNQFFSNGYISDSVAVYEFTTNPSPSFPGTGGGNSGTPTKNFGCTSFVYDLCPTSSVPVSAPVVSPSLTYANVGDNVTLTASAFGTPPVYYQWFFGNSQTPIPGETNATLVLTNIQALHCLGHAGSYGATAWNSLAGPQSSGPAQVVILPPVAGLKILPLGDSITYGQGAAGGYRAPLYQDLVAANFNPVFIGNQTDNSVPWLPYPNHEGHSGSRIDQIIDGFPTWISTLSDPDIILLLIGTNDYGQGHDTANATNRLDQLISLITSTRPGAKLFVANVLMRTDSAVANAAIETTFNAYIPTMVASHQANGEQVYFVDLHSALGASDLVDGLHPNQSGYNKMAAAWTASIISRIPVTGNNKASFTLTGANGIISYSGVPGFTYVVQRASSLSSGNWTSISTNTVGADGMLNFSEPVELPGGTSPAAAFYRVLLQ